MTIIFTDGSSRGNPGPGGWGSVVIRGEKGKEEVLEIGGREEKTTNNRMEIRAAIGGLAKTDVSEEVKIYTDSSYLINGITKWIKGWKRNGWLTKVKEEVLNKDLWMELDALVKDRTVVWKYVGGHVGIAGNERCDVIATTLADKKEVKFFKGSLTSYHIPDILNIKEDVKLLSNKKSKSSHSKAKAYSYVSLVDGQVKMHQTWPDCEKRVKGVGGARFKKALDRDGEMKIRREFGEISPL